MMSEVYFDLRNPVDLVVHQLWLSGLFRWEEIDLCRRCVEKGLRGDFCGG